MAKGQEMYKTSLGHLILESKKHQSKTAAVMSKEVRSQCEEPLSDPRRNKLNIYENNYNGLKYVKYVKMHKLLMMV